MATRRTAPPPPARSAPRQTFGDRMAARMAQQSQTPPPPMVQAAAQQAIAQSQQAQRNMAPGTGGRGTLQQYEAMKQQQAGAGVPAFAQQAAQGALGKGMAPPSQMLQSSGPTPPPMPQYGAQTQMPPGGGLPNAAPGGMAPMGPGTQTGGPAPMGMAPAGMAAAGAFKKGGAVKAKAFAKGGSVKATSMGSVKTTKPKMGSASSRADGCAIRGKTRA